MNIKILKGMSSYFLSTLPSFTDPSALRAPRPNLGEERRSGFQISGFRSSSHRSSSHRFPVLYYLQKLESNAVRYGTEQSVVRC